MTVGIPNSDLHFYLTNYDVSMSNTYSYFTGYLCVVKGPSDPFPGPKFATLQSKIIVPTGSEFLVKKL